MKLSYRPVLVARRAGCGAVLAGVALLAWSACDSQQSPAPAQPKAPAAVPAKPAADTASLRAEAEEIFATRCQTCHGAQGAGDGPGAKALEPKPRNFQDAAFQDEVSDEHIANIIQYGGAAVGRSPTMPGNPDLMGRPEVVQQLVAVVRSLRRP